MATESVVPSRRKSTAEAPEAEYVKKTYSPEYLAEHRGVDGSGSGRGREAHSPLG